MTASKNARPSAPGAPASPLRGGPTYLDYNATTPVDQRVVEAMLPFLHTHFGNPSSSHEYARPARVAINTAREHVAHVLGCGPEEVIFTGSGSEADHLAIRGVALAAGSAGDHLITQRTEHPAVLRSCASLERLHGFTVTYLPVDEFGQVDPGALTTALTPRTVLVSIMHANSETGTLQPIAELAGIAHEHDIAFHTDAAQSVGKVRTDVRELGVDLLTVVGHKIYGPKGIGALYHRDARRLEPVSYGGGQEGGVRAGTENVANIVGLGEACRLVAEQGVAMDAVRRLRDLLHARLASLPGRVHLNGHPEDRLPNTLNVSIDGVDGDRLLAMTPGVAASTGSACHAGDPEPSPVLLAMGHSPRRARSALRLSLGRWTTSEEVEAAAAAVTAAAHRLQP